MWHFRKERARKVVELKNNNIANQDYVERHNEAIMKGWWKGAVDGDFIISQLIHWIDLYYKLLRFPLNLFYIAFIFFTLCSSTFPTFSAPTSLYWASRRVSLARAFCSIFTAWDFLCCWWPTIDRLWSRCSGCPKSRRKAWDCPAGRNDHVAPEIFDLMYAKLMKEFSSCHCSGYESWIIVSYSPTANLVIEQSLLTRSCFLILTIKWIPILLTGSIIN